MLVRETPFEFGRELSGPELVDRHEEVDEVVRVLGDAERLFLIGPRRFGKTSILRAAAEKARRHGIAVLRYNVESFSGLTELAQTAIADGARVLKGPIQKVAETLQAIFSRVRPQLDYNPLTDVWSVSLASDRTNQASKPPLAEVLNGLDRLSRDAGVKLGLIFDEFQRAIELGGEQEEARLRAAIQEHKHVGYVFAGSDTRLLSDMTGNPSRPFYRIGSRRFIGPVPRSDFRPAIRRGFSRGDIEIEDDAIETILNQAADVPYNIQRLAHACWNAARTGSTINAEDVTRVLDDLVRRDDPFYTQSWNRLTLHQQRALVAVASAKEDGLFSANVLAAARLSPGSMRYSLEALRRNGLVRVEESRGARRYVLEDPFFAAWLRLFVHGAGESDNS